MKIINKFLYRLFGVVPKKESTLEPNKKVKTYYPDDKPHDVHQWMRHIHSLIK